jgi:hypothetical protein
VVATEVDAYDWTGRSIKYHRVQIREALGFREFSVADEARFSTWLVEDVCPSGLGEERQREARLAQVPSRAPGAARAESCRAGAGRGPGRGEAAVLRADGAAPEQPDETVRRTIYPVVGEGTHDLVREAMANDAAMKRRPGRRGAGRGQSAAAPRLRRQRHRVRRPPGHRGRVLPGRGGPPPARRARGGRLPPLDHLTGGRPGRRGLSLLITLCSIPPSR